MSRAFFLFGPSCYLLLLLALRVGLISLLACALGVLLSTLRMLHTLSMIALAVLFSGGAVRLCSISLRANDHETSESEEFSLLGVGPRSHGYANQRREVGWCRWG